MEELTCKYCKRVFKSKRNLQSHKKRLTGCISWREMDEKFQYYENQLRKKEIKSHTIENEESE